MILKKQSAIKPAKRSLRPLLITTSLMLLLLSLLVSAYTTPVSNEKTITCKDSLAAPLTSELEEQFPCMDELSLQLNAISPKALQLALKGYQYYRENKIISAASLLAIADMSAPSNRERLYIIDPNKGTLLYHTLVAHGKNSGDRYATRFSNKPSSLESCMGFFKTGDTYQGKHGNSLRLIGLEKGINDRANERGIVIHGADYVSNQIAASSGRIGRSWGCPAVPSSLSNEIITALQHDQCLFIYHPSYQLSHQ